MSCLSRTELARIALGREGSSGSSAHLQACDRCQAELEELRSLTRQLAKAHAVFDHLHEQDRARLLASLPSSRSQSTATSTRNQLISWMGALTMKQRFALGSAAALIVAVAAVIWIAFAPRPAYAMDGVAESIRKARSYEYDMTMEVNMPREAGKAPAKVEMRSRFFWLAPGSYRMETMGGDAMPGHDSLMIFPAGKPGIEIDHKTKKFIRQNARLGQISQLMMVDKLSTFSGQADRLLGTNEIDGKTAKGFQIQARKIDPDVYPGLLEIWIDTQTNLPAQIRYEVKSEIVPTTIRMTDFHWNVDLDPKLFDPTPPAGYAENVPPPTKVDDQVEKIATCLKLYAEHGGHYPRVKMLYGDVTRDEFVKLSGAPYPPRNEADFKDARIKDVYDAIRGFATINMILRENADAAYHGKTVGPDDKDKVLLRWKLDGGSYEVIYGDLRAEAVPAGRLRMLEGK